MNLPNIKLNNIVDFIENDLTEEDYANIMLPVKTINTLQEDIEYLFNMNLSDVIELNKYVEQKNKKEQKQKTSHNKKVKVHINVVGIDLGRKNTLTASDDNMNRPLVIQNKRIWNTINKYEQAIEKTDELNKELHITIQKNMSKIVNELLNYYPEASIFIVGKIEGVHSINYLMYDIFIEMFKQKTRIKNIKIVSVDEKYTSIKCPKCGYKNAKNRTSSNHFKCKECRFVYLNDDIVACVNMIDKYKQNVKNIRYN